MELNIASMADLEGLFIVSRELFLDSIFFVGQDGELLHKGDGKLFYFVGLWNTLELPYDRHKTSRGDYFEAFLCQLLGGKFVQEKDSSQREEYWKDETPVFTGPMNTGKEYDHFTFLKFVKG